MRFLLLAFLAFPALAQSPSTRDIGFKCDDKHCVLTKEDWQWVMESMMAKDDAIQKLLTRCGWKSV